jgi:hypothetical protein
MKIKDPQYTATLFDVLAWYKTIGRPQFGHISTAVSIHLGRYMIASWSEFSVMEHTITYHDDILQKSLKDDKFEMSEPKRGQVRDVSVRLS